MSAVSNDLEAQQSEIQRKLGRCMIRLQQYERLLKSMVASMVVQGPLDQVQAVRDQQSAAVRNRTLGTLVAMFTADCLVTTPTNSEVGPDDETRAGGESADTAWGSMRFNIPMPPERYAQVKDGLADLVTLRNDLVHHLIERFDISEKKRVSRCGQPPRQLLRKN